jgi:hypothetical protein
MRHFRHRWTVRDGREVCTVCYRVRDKTAEKRSRSAVRLGKDVERRLAKRFGWTKIGQLGDAVDLLGKTVKVQSKSTRDAAPGYFPGYGIKPLADAKWASEPIDKMDPLYPDLWPVLAKSFVSPGVPTATWLVVRAEDWDKHYGRWSPPNPNRLPYYVMSGDYWLDVAGMDT